MDKKLYVWWYCEKDKWEETLKYANYHVVYAKDLDEARDKIEEYIGDDPFCSYGSGYRKGKFSIGLIEANIEQNWLMNSDEEEDEE